MSMKIKLKNNNVVVKIECLFFIEIYTYNRKI